MKRITPACAGKSEAVKKEYPSEEDHPRLRGEKAFGLGFILGGFGSPPLARGKAPIKNMKTPGTRITPACAGKRLQ